MLTALSLFIGTGFAADVQFVDENTQRVTCNDGTVFNFGPGSYVSQATADQVTCENHGGLANIKTIRNARKTNNLIKPTKRPSIGIKANSLKRSR